MKVKQDSPFSILVTGDCPDLTYLDLYKHDGCWRYLHTSPKKVTKVKLNLDNVALDFIKGEINSSVDGIKETLKVEYGEAVKDKNIKNNPKAKSLQDFKQGDIIVRVANTKVYGEVFHPHMFVAILAITRDDDRFREYPMEFLGISQNNVFMRYRDLYPVDSVFRLPIEQYDDGNWEYYIEPDFLDNTV